MTISFITSGVGGDTGSSTTRATASFSLTTGQHVFVWAVWESANATLSVTDTAGNTYTPLTRSWVGSAVGGQWFYCLNATGNASNVVTVTWSSAAAYRTVEALVVSGAVSSVGVQVTEKTTADTVIEQAATVTCNPGAMLLAGYKGFGGDLNKRFYKDTTPMVNVASGSSFSEAAYLARPAGDAATVGPKYIDANSSVPKILHVVTIDVSGSIPRVPLQVCVCT